MAAVENKSQDAALDARTAAQTTVPTGPAPSAPQTVAGPAAGPGKPRLKLARILQPGANKRPEAKPKAEIHSGGTGAASSGDRSSAASLFTPATANAIFMVIILTMVGLTALDLRASVQAGSLLGIAAPSGDRPVTRSAIAAVPAVPDFGAVLDGITKRPIIDAGGGVLPGPTNDPHRGGWAIYALKNLALAARSRSPDAEEAIIVDTEKKITHLLALGQVIRIEQQDVKLVSVDDKEAILSDGVEKVPVRPRASVAATN